MIIVWKGAGILAALIPIGTVWIIHNYIGQSPEYTGFALILSALPVWTLGRRWNSTPDQEYIEARSGARYRARSRHSFFWINMEYWALVLLAWGLYQYTTEILGWAGTPI